MNQPTILRRALLFGAHSLSTISTRSRASESFLSLPKGLWAWHVAPDDWPALRAFCDNQKIANLMLSLPTVMRMSLARGDRTLLAGLAALKRPGLSLMALMGEQDWVTNRKTALPASLAEMLEVQRRHTPFDGFHLDIEPQLLPQWRGGDRAAVAEQYLALLSRIRAATAGIPLEVTAHPNYAELPLVGGGNFLNRIVAAVDGVSLMAYRDQPAAALSFARRAIRPHVR